MLSISNLSFYFGSRALYDGANLHIKPKTKIGLIGANGTGKSTLLRLISGEYSPDGGNISKSGECTIGFLNQDLLSYQTDDSILHVAMQAFERALELQIQIDAVLHKMETNYEDKDVDLLSKLQEEFERLDGYTIQSKSEEILEGLGFTTDDLNKPLRLPNYNLLNNLIIIALFVFAGYIAWSGTGSQLFLYILFFAALAYGVLFVLPIGGADMPVVISLLNSFTGLAAALGGFLYGNMVMLTGGILVGSAGTILTFAMCNAMNRSLVNVIFGSFGSSEAPMEGSDSQTISGSIKKTTVSDVAILMNYSQRIIIVPGYGLAVAQAQHAIHELEQILVNKGISVKYAIHPVAGRMPGHMNVLLAETNVDYDKLVEMEDINPEFSNTDVVFVVGANDVVNPAAHNNPASPIYGMPILDVENAKHIIVNKRSMNAGYAGIDNLLFYQPKTSMLFGDAKKVLQDLVAEIKSV